MPRRSYLFFPFLLAIVATFAVGCGGGSKPKDLVRESTASPSRGTPQAAAAPAAPAATAVLSPTPAATPSATPAPSPTATATPAPTATATTAPPPVDVLADGTHGYVVSSGTLVYADASTQSAVVGKLKYEQQLDLLAKVRGERFVVGSQDWPMANQNWSNLWYKTPEGYVYSAYVWIPKPGQVLPESLGAGERWVNVNLATQTAQAMVGDRVVYTANVTSGKNGYETPTGHWRVGYQVPNETMTSGQAGINDPAEHYDVKNVLFTQYFDGMGDALHLNYWQPESVFGNSRTSHGCVGLYIQDAQWLWMFGQTGMRVEINSNGQVLPPPPAAPPPTQRATVPTVAPAPTRAPAPAPAQPTATRPAVATATSPPARPTATVTIAETPESTVIPPPATLPPTRQPTPLAATVTTPVLTPASATLPATQLPPSSAAPSVRPAIVAATPIVTGTPR